MAGQMRRNRLDNYRHRAARQMPWQVLPARVMTDEITVAAPVSSPVVGNITATQVQPHVAAPVNVLNGTAASGTQTMRTSPGISATTASGPVVITINATDAGGVGLSGPPTLVLNNGASPVTLPCTTPSATVGPFVYNWNVPGSIAKVRGRLQSRLLTRSSPRIPRQSRMRSRSSSIRPK